MSRQLEAALADSRRQAESLREKTVSRVSLLQPLQMVFNPPVFPRTSIWSACYYLNTIFKLG